MNKSARETKAKQLAAAIIDELLREGTRLRRINEYGQPLGDWDRKPALLAVKKIVYQALREVGEA